MVKVKRRRLTPIRVTIVVVCLGLLGTIAALTLKPTHRPIPSNITKKISFTIFYPTLTISQINVQPSTLNYNSANQGFSYEVLLNSKKVVISEQATPDIFSQNGVYSFKLDQAHEYDSFNTSAGEVALTKPDELSGQTVAWDNTKGTLILAHAFQTLSESEWKLLFNNIQIVK